MQYLLLTILSHSSQEFDGGNVRYDRGDGACNGQAEGGQCQHFSKGAVDTEQNLGDSDAVFLVEEGGSISYVPGLRNVQTCTH